MGNEKDVFEWRRFGHWNSSAAKARFSAFVLWSLRGDAWIGEMADKCGHQRGDDKLAISEAFCRESAIALELIVKAVIAHNLQARGADPPIEGVPATHNIPKLWKDARLPDLPREDLYRLHLAKSILMWSGRYATPRTVRAWEDENKDFDALEEPASESGKVVFRKPIIMGWAEFDHLYQIAKSFL
jgi:hypothetical protein